MCKDVLVLVCYIKLNYLLVEQNETAKSHSLKSQKNVCNGYLCIND